MAQRAQITLDFSPQLNLEKLNSIIAAMKKAFDGLGGDIDFLNMEELQQELNKLQGSLDEIDTEKLQKALNEAQKEIEELANNLDSGLSSKAVDGLARNFFKAKDSAEQLLTQQKAALQAMKISGNAGTAAYQELENQIKETEAEVKKYSDALTEVQEDTEALAKTSQKTRSAFDFNQASEAVTRISAAFEEVVKVGAEYESTLAAVGAITGQSGEKLNVLGESARELALTFGGSASDQLKSYQGILSKFGAQVADTPEALAKLAKNVNILSAASGDSAATSMNAITDAMLQFGLVTGDATKDAETSTRIINGLAASAQVGAAEIPQVAEAILQAGVAAKGANLNFEQTNAALQVLAVGGKTGSEAGVALRNVLGLLQNASGPAEQAMKKLGTTSKELGNILTTEGLDAALVKLKAGMENLGTQAERNVALFDIFGTENASAAGILLDNVDKYGEFLEGIKAGQEGIGAAFEQATQRMDTASTQMAKARAFVQDQFITLFQTIGSGASAALGSIAQLSPLITNLAGVKSILPEGALKQAGEQLSQFRDKLLSVGNLNGKLEGAGKVVEKFSKNISAQFGSLQGLISNPIVLGVGAGVAALTYFFTQTEKGKEVWADLEATASDAFKTIEPLITKGSQLLGTTVDILLEIGEAVYEFLIAPFELAGSLITTVFGGDSTTEFDVLRMIVEALGKAIDTMSKYLVAAKEGITSFGDGVKFVKEVIRTLIENAGKIFGAFTTYAQTALNPANWFSSDGEEARKKAAAVLNTALNGAVTEATGRLAKANLGEAIAESASIKKDLDANDALGKLIKKFQSAKTEVEKNSIAAEIAKQAPQAVEATKQITDANGKLVTTYEISIDAAKKFADVQRNTLEGKAKSANNEVLKGIEAQGKAYGEAKARVKALADELAKPRKGGISEQLLNDYKQAQAVAAKEGKTLSDALNKGMDLKLNVDGIKLPEAALKDFGDQLQAMEQKARDSKIATTLQEITTIKGDIDKQGKIEELVKKFKTAKTEVERNSIAAQLQKEMPDAVKSVGLVVDATGKLSKSYEVNTAKILENATANRARLSNDLVAKQREYVANIDKESESYRKGLIDVQKLGKEIEEKSKKGLDTKELEAQYGKLNTRLQGNLDNVVKMAAATIKYGGSTEEAIKKVSDGLGISKEQAKKLLDAQQQSTSEAKLTANAVGELASAFEAAKKAANEAFTKSLGGLSEVLRQQKRLQEDEAKARKANDIGRLKEIDAEKKKLAEQRTQIIEQGKAQKDESDQLAKNEEQAKRLLGVAQNKKKESESEFAAAKKAYDLKENEFGLQEKVRQLALQTQLIDEERQKNVYDDFVLAEAKAKQVKEQTQEFTRIFGKFVETTENGEFKIRPNAKLKPEERKTLTDEIFKVREQAQKAANDAKEIRLKINLEDKELQKKIRDFEKIKLSREIELGIKTQADLLPILQQEADVIMSEVVKIQERITAQRAKAERERMKLSVDASEEQKTTLETRLKAESLALDKQLLELQTKEIAARDEVRKLVKSIYDRQNKDIEDALRERRELADKEFARESALLTRLAELFTTAASTTSERDRTSEINNIASSEEQAIKRLDKLKTTISDEAFERKKFDVQKRYQLQREEAEKKHQLRLQNLRNVNAGAELQRNLEHSTKVLKAEKEAAQSRLDNFEKLLASRKALGLELFQNEDEIKQYAKLKDALTQAEIVFEEKGTALGIAATALQETITESLTNLFTGDVEAAKEPFKKLLAMLAGALSRQASALVTKLVLDDLLKVPAGGAASLLLAPVLTGVINAGIQALIQPVLNGMTSFASGGRIDSPTLAIVGDGARLGESNREWIFRDTQLQQVVHQAGSAGADNLIPYLQQINESILSINGRVHILERDIWNAQRKESVRVSRRAR